MARTPEQVEADEALTAAIQRVIAVRYPDDLPFALTEYVVITSQHRWDDDGEGVTAVGALYRDDDVPYHRALGLLEYATARIRKAICDDED